MRVTTNTGIIAIAVLLATIFITAPLYPAASLATRYENARKNTQRLVGTLPEIADRAPWLEAIAELSAIVADDTRGEVAERCYYLIGQCNHHLFDRFHETAFFDQALRAYRRLIRQFPAGRLADDAQFLIGVLYVDKDPAQAYLELAKVTTFYPNGDMAQRAQDRARELRRQITPNAAKVEPARPVPSISHLATLDQVSYWSTQDYTRVVFYLSAPIQYRENMLTPDPGENDPARIYLDLEGCRLSPKIGHQIDITDGFLRDVRLGQYRPDLARAVLDIDSIENHKVFTMADPFRIVVDVRGKRPAETGPAPAVSKTVAAKPKNEKTQTPEAAKPKTNLARASNVATSKTKPAQAPARQAAKAGTGKAQPPDAAAIRSAKKLPSLAQQLGLGVSRIVIDPGHGGRDKGAIGGNGTYEKDITLAIAKKLQQAIEKNTRCKVLLTRADDRFISLEERTAIANGEKADLFISIHVNAHEDRSIHGFETYFLNLSRDRESARVAAFENATSKKKISDLEAILKDLLRNTKISESSRLAATVHRQLAHGLSKEYKNFHDLGVKQAPFYVLLGAEMPSILVEAAFLSNEKEEQLLQQKAFQAQIAHGIAFGIGRYIGALDKTARLEDNP